MRLLLLLKKSPDFLLFEMDFCKMQTNTCVKMTPQSLDDAIRSSAVSPLVESLELRGFNDDNIWDVCMWISRGSCPKLIALNLHWNHIGHRGSKRLAFFLRDDPAFQNLESLNLALNDKVGCAALLYAFKEERVPWQQVIQTQVRRLLRFNDAKPLKLCKPNVLPRLKRLTYTIDDHDTLELERQIRLGALPALTKLELTWPYTLDFDGRLRRSQDKLQQTVAAHRSALPVAPGLAVPAAGPGKG